MFRFYCIRLALAAALHGLIPHLQAEKGNGKLRRMTSSNTNWLNLIRSAIVHAACFCCFSLHSNYLGHSTTGSLQYCFKVAWRNLQCVAFAGSSPGQMSLALLQVAAMLVQIDRCLQLAIYIPRPVSSLVCLHCKRFRASRSFTTGAMYQLQLSE